MLFAKHFDAHNETPPEEGSYPMNLLPPVNRTRQKTQHSVTIQTLKQKLRCARLGLGIGLALMLCHSVSFAANPVKIAFLSKESTFFGDEYYVYRVACSDGSEAKISGWDKKRTWCPGVRKTACQKSRLKAATVVCR